MATIERPFQGLIAQAEGFLRDPSGAPVNRAEAELLVSKFTDAFKDIAEFCKWDYGVSWGDTHDDVRWYGSRDQALYRRGTGTLMRRVRADGQGDWEVAPQEAPIG